MTAIRIVDITDEPRSGRSRRAPTRLRPPVVRLLGGRRSRLEGGPALPGSRAPLRPPRRPGRPRRTTRSLPRATRAGREPVRPDRSLEPSGFNPFADDDEDAPIENPFAPGPPARRRSRATRRASSRCSAAASRCSGATPRCSSPTTRRSAYAQFGPLSAYPRAQRLARAVPAAARRAAARRHHLHRHDGRGARPRPRDGARRGGLRRLAGRGFAAVEAYPERGTRPDATSAATPAFWVDPGSRSSWTTSGSRSSGAS